MLVCIGLISESKHEKWWRPRIHIWEANEVWLCGSNKIVWRTSILVIVECSWRTRNVQSCNVGWWVYSHVVLRIRSGSICDNLYLCSSWHFVDRSGCVLRPPCSQWQALYDTHIANFYMYCLWQPLLMYMWISWSIRTFGIRPNFNFVNLMIHSKLCIVVREEATF